MKVSEWKAVISFLATVALTISTLNAAEAPADRATGAPDRAYRLRGAPDRAVPGQAPGAARSSRGRPVPSVGQNPLLRHIGLFDKDGDGALSRQEYESAVTELFSLLDANGDGKLDKAEMSANLNVLNTPASQWIRQIMLSYDIKRDNKITPSECLLPPKAFAEFDSNKSGALENDDLEKLTMTQAIVLLDPQRRSVLLLAELDQNKDGKLTSDELKLEESALREADANSDGQLDANELKSLPPLPLDHPKRQAQDLIARMDQDGDQMLAENEFSRARIPFDTVDTNKDGLLDVKELTVWYESGQGRGTRIFAIGRMVEGIMSRYDKNNDGKLTKDELQGMPERMWQQWDLNADGVVEATEIEDAMLAPRREGRPGIPGAMPGGARGQPKGAGPQGGLIGRDPAEIVKTQDRDNDGKLTAEESGMEPRVFGRIDTDGDGRLTKEEIAAGQEMLRQAREKARQRAADYREKAARTERPNK